MRISTLRAKGFSVVKMAGPATELTHKSFFTVDGKAARQTSSGYRFNLRGWYDKDIPREIMIMEATNG